MSESSERKRNKVDPPKVKAGDLMAFVYYGKVEKAGEGGLSVRIKSLDEAEGEFSIAGKALIASSFSADQFLEEEKVSKTRAAESLVTSFNRPLTVCFVRQAGGTRVLRGRLLQPEPLLGRSYVEDLDVSGKERIRLVDHRTIRYLIVEGVKYVVKGKPTPPRL